MDLTDPDKKPGKVVAADGHTYHKSASANSTTAPTSGSTKSAADSSAAANIGFSEEEIDFITVIDMHWGIHGELLTDDNAEQTYLVPKAVYARCFANEAVKAALLERGVQLRTLKVKTSEAAVDVPEWRRVNLSPEQLIVANVMCDLYDTRNDRKKLQDLGVSSTKYNAWLRQPEFQRYLQGRAESLVQGAVHEAGLSLVDKVRSGDLKAIEYLHAYTGKFNIRPNADGTTGALTADSVRGLIQNIIEIIVEEVEDPVLGARISDRLGMLIATRSTADQLVGSIMNEEKVIVPEIMESRVITPEIEALMQTGVGSDT